MRPSPLRRQLRDVQFPDVLNVGGTVAPGFSPGTLTIDGTYTQQAAIRGHTSQRTRASRNFSMRSSAGRAAGKNSICT